MEKIRSNEYVYKVDADKARCVSEDGKMPDASECDVFSAITHKLSELHRAKNADYGDSFHELFKEHGVIVGYIHLREKLQRIKSLMSNDAKVKGERMEDSLMDLASYAIMTLAELRINGGEIDGTKGD